MKLSAMVRDMYAKQKAQKIEVDQHKAEHIDDVTKIMQRFNEVEGKIISQKEYAHDLFVQIQNIDIYTKKFEEKLQIAKQ